MIMWPFDPAATGSPTTHRVTGSHIMWAGTPYEVRRAASAALFIGGAIPIRRLDLPEDNLLRLHV
jgi:hypothetical protein